MDDDPNNDGDLADWLAWQDAPGLMGYTPGSVIVGELLALGTDDLAETEFRVGQIDTLTNLLHWLS
jgi:hypothetical protein